jgi:antitoxin component YwqK of YwqJK toxin-antitoxin module
MYYQNGNLFERYSHSDGLEKEYYEDGTLKQKGKA